MSLLGDVVDSSRIIIASLDFGGLSLEDDDDGELILICEILFASFVGVLCKRLLIRFRCSCFRSVCIFCPFHERFEYLLFSFSICCLFVEYRH